MDKIPQFTKFVFPEIRRIHSSTYNMGRVWPEPMLMPKLSELLAKTTWTNTGDIVMMNTIKVKRDDLLAKVKKNRDQHKAVFEEALVGYQKAVIKYLKEQLKKAKEGLRIHARITLVQPEDQTKEYDRVITMLEMSTQEEIEMNEHEFAQYVMDDWNWSDQFWVSNSMYSATAGTEARKRKLM